MLTTIREARELAGLSQRAVGRRLGFHPTVYNKIESGARVLDVVEFVALARVIGIDPIELLGNFIVNIQQERIIRESSK